MVTSISLVDDGSWKAFDLDTNVPVKVVANPTGASVLVEITKSANQSNFCPPESNDDQAYTASGKVYLAGCTIGTGKVNIVNTATNQIIQTYTVAITDANPPQTWDITLSPCAQHLAA